LKDLDTSPQNVAIPDICQVAVCRDCYLLSAGVDNPDFIVASPMESSCLQVLWTVPLLRMRYVDPAEALFRSAPANPADDFPSQACLGSTRL